MISLLSAAYRPDLMQSIAAAIVAHAAADGVAPQPVSGNPRLWCHADGAWKVPYVILKGA